MKKLSMIALSLLLLFLGAYAVNQAVKPDSTLDSVESAVTIEETSHEEETSQEETTLPQTTSQEDEEGGLIQSNIPNTELRDAFGNTVNLHDLLDKPTIINVWASWCPPCQEEMPYFQAQYEEHKDSVNFIMINATGSRPTETIETANAFIREYHYNFPVYYDIDLNTQIDLGSFILPTSFSVDKLGNIEKKVGELSEKALDDWVQALIEE